MERPKTTIHRGLDRMADLGGHPALSTRCDHFGRRLDMDAEEKRQEARGPGERRPPHRKRIRAKVTAGSMTVNVRHLT